MKRTLARLGVAVTLIAAFGVASAAPIGAARSRAGSNVPASCDSFGGYYEVVFAIGIVTGFAEAFDEDGELDSDEVRNVAYLILSPKLEPLTADLAKTAPRIVRPFFRLQAKVYGQGVDLLRDDLGLTDDQIEAIADADLSNLGDSEEFTSDFEVTKQQVTDAAAELGAAIEKAKGSFEPTARQERALENLSRDCGTTPDEDVDCDELFPAADVEALIGEVAEESGTCQWEAVEPETGLTPKLAVQIFRSAATFEDRKDLNADSAVDVTDIGDEAFITPGFTSQTSGSTCGKTIYVLDGDDTVMVSVCKPDDVDPTDDEMVQLADDVLGRLADAG